MKEEIASGAAVASGMVKSAPPVVVTGALYAGIGVPELIQYATLLWLLYQMVDAVWTHWPRWKERARALRAALRGRS
ncbi:hypothetical protein [Chitinilyticum litopenaei]|uniref:hypothetical protein n=1 Tax=Chitinilyticum litopenaei TaxID=1121276 RepID=UPI0004117F1B|nr:hypothetical protein [Chitinilyticum litopenaei]